MRTIKTALAAVLMLIVLVLTGCYMDVPSGSDSSVTIEIQSRSLPGEDYTGDMFRVKLFVEGSVEVTPVDFYDPISGQTVYYTVLPVLPAVPFNGNPYEEFPYDGTSSGGSFTLEGVIPGRYQLVIEEYNRWTELPTVGYSQNQRAGISSAFIVGAGENSTTTIVLSQYSSGDTN